MNHYVYRITHVDSGRWYIGIRSCTCDPREDRYWGSGKVIKAAIRKYGKRAFQKLILAIISTREEAARIEAVLVGCEQIKDRQCMNLVEGGDCGVRHNEGTRLRISLAQRGRQFSLEHRAKIRAALVGVSAPWSPERRERHAESNRRPEVRERIARSLRGRSFSEAHRAALSLAHRALQARKRSA